MVIEGRYPFQDDLPLAGVPAPESGHERMESSMVDARRSGRTARGASAKLASTSRARAHCVNFIHELQAYRTVANQSEYLTFPFTVLVRRRERTCHKTGPSTACVASTKSIWQELREIWPNNVQHPGRSQQCSRCQFDLREYVLDTEPSPAQLSTMVFYS